MRCASDTPDAVVRMLRRSSRPSITVRAVPSSVLLADTVLGHVARLLELPIVSLDRSSSFINLGGHSLLAVKLSAACKKDGIHLPISKILLCKSLIELCSSATLLFHPSPCSPRSPTARRKSIQEVMAQVSMQDSIRHGSVPQFSTPTSFSMSEMQLSFLHSYRKNPGTNIINFFETYNTSDVPVMKAAWRTVIESEPIFRTIFDPETLQANENLSVPFRWNDIVCNSESKYRAELAKDVAPENMEYTFDCITYPASGTSTIVWRVHHAFIDGMSAQLMYGKLRRLVMGQHITPGTSFSSVTKDIQALQHSSREANQAFWRKEMEKHPQPVGDLALQEPSSTDRIAAIANISFTIPINKVSTAAQQAGVSLAAWYQAAWAMVLSMYTDSASVVFGTVLSGRNLPVAGADDTVGPLINTLPFHASIDPTQSVADYLQSVFTHSVALQSVQCSSPQDGYTRTFASALAMEFDMEAPDDHAVRPIRTSWFRVIPDMPLSVYMSAKGTLRLCFKPSKYAIEDMQLLADHFRRAILLLRSPNRTMGDRMSKLLTHECRDTLMRFGNCNTQETSLSSIQDDLVTLFEKAAGQNPSDIALEKAAVAMTYAELDRLSSILAKRLQGHVEPGEVVCVHADRSINWIVAIYGVLKAGAVYSAQDAGLPDHIRNMNFQTAGARIFLTPEETQKSIKPDACSFCLSVEEIVREGSHADLLPHRSTPRPDDNAYLCFTSGSTGKPKGCMCHHAGLVAFQKDPEVRFFSAPGQKISQLMSPAFDGSIHEIFSALSYGGALVLADGIDPFSHLRKATAAILTPSVAKILEPEDFPELQTVYVVGEPMPQYVNDIWSKSKNMYNMYGPTEATCGATIQPLRPGRRVTIGPPNPTTRVYILDRNQQLVPPGVVGEIYCAGVQVARGYIGRAELTAEKFLPDSVCKCPGEMMYRTGDRGLFNHAGEVECLGRNDRQIKLRGYRTDLNDIEMRVAQAIPEATAVAICPKDDYLVAMVQPETLDISDVRSRITRVLPIHAVLRVISAVAKFPMTPAGKLDYKEIAVQCGAASQAVPASKPMSATETTIVQVWKQLLALPATEKVTAESNFANLGGHSVLQLRLASKLSTVFEVRIPTAKVIQAVNLCEMAAVVDHFRSQSSAAPAESDMKSLGRNNVSPIEAEWFEKYEIKQGSSAFNVTFACALGPNQIDLDHLTASWNAVLARHHIFRSRYNRDESRAERVRRSYARYCPQVARVEEFDLWREVNRPFYLGRQHPVRVLVSEKMMLVSMSHIIADLTTLQVVLREVMELYNGNGLPKVDRRYADTMNWSASATSAQQNWWQDYLQGSNSSQHMVSKVPKRTTYSGQTRLIQLSTALARRVIQHSETAKVTLHQMALAAVALALQAESHSTDIVLGGPYFNRQAEDLDTVGLFLEPIPIRIQHNDQGRSFLQSVQASSQSAVANAIPWNQLLQAVGEAQPDFPNHALLDIMVTFHDDRTAAKLPIEGLKPLITYTSGSKFMLLVEFMAVSDDCVLMRLEYDSTCILKPEISRIEGLIKEALHLITTGVGYTAMKEKLRNVKDDENEESDKTVAFFGKDFSVFQH
ncbi:BcNRPS1, nonribosomal peptide synthetase [Mytilinidion resinicola]|uniref:BcNRPS1, nonribosomal peptide synthetase n=1 Tax=Mytilinidion resinicola TaxID=574789 RepID=A0A6A6YKP4_9PEZI|nr:BcNRPS1, nonribosomal peptide synthetase [Mytilinidion resinicola]KAF2809436.1 BcNRPS1, nonribosomal peptide synthetase [Mytilinidion resinicola]